MSRRVSFAEIQSDDSAGPSAGSTGSASSRSSPSRTSSSPAVSLRSHLMREHQDRDPLFYYEVVQVLGVGSMGSVAKVRKREEAIGGSARKGIVDSLRREQKLNDCFSVPIVGGIFKFCMGGDSRSPSFHRKKSRTASKLDDASSRSTMSSYQVTYALKSIHLNRVTDPTFVQELINEVEILRTLDHPHIVRPIETFRHRNQLFIVMELCSGGDLYARDPYTEEEAARIITSILSAVSFLHQNNICHRDLKYENILFESSSPRSNIKLIDFGLSKKYSADKELTEGVGTIYSMSPEVLKGSYTNQADMWSVGVISFMLLSSQMPFYGRKRRHIVEQIMKGQYQFKGRRWQRVSPQAKEFVEDLLVMDPNERSTAEEALGSSWLNRRYSATMRNPTVEEMDSTTESLMAYADYSKLKKLALMVIAHKSTTEEIGILRKVFQKYDKRKDGIISHPEFQDALSQYGLDEEEIDRLFESLDLDGTGKIRYTEFLAACIEARGAIDEERLAEAFDRLDCDDSGYITAENLLELYGEEFPMEELKEIIAQADLTKDNRISYSEFLALWEDKSEAKRQDLYLSIRESADASSVSSLNYSTDEMTSSNHETYKEKVELSSENAQDTTMARESYLEGKKLSERKVDEALAIEVKQAEKLMFDVSTHGGSEVVGEKYLGSVPEGTPVAESNANHPTADI